MPMKSMDGINIEPNKQLGQHWLTDKDTLAKIAGYANIGTDDVVVEIGPGLGTLTEILTNQAGRVIAVEYDRQLADRLSGLKLNNLIVMNEDFIKFNLNVLPEGYKIIGNIPYYITGKIVRKILSSNNKPKIVVLLVQKEVAERLASKKGKMSVASVVAQYYSEVSLGDVVKADKFDPPPKVDSRVVIFKPRPYNFKKLINPELEKIFFTVVKAGFSSKRKKLHTSLAGGLGVSVDKAKETLSSAGIDSNLRAQDLSIDDWLRLAVAYKNKK